MDDRQKQEMKSKMKWQQVILVLAILAFLIGLIIISIVSYFQTEQGFKNLNDPSIVIFGLQFGMMISNAFSLFIQYGQNAILYIRKSFLTDEELFDFFGMSVTPKKIAFGLFLVFSSIDALTNCIWFYQTVEQNSNGVLDVVVKIIGYSAMILSVFVEEALGLALDAMGKAYKGLMDIIALEKRSNKANSSSNTNGLENKNIQQNNPYQNNRNNNQQNNNRQNSDPLQNTGMRQLTPDQVQQMKKEAFERQKHLPPQHNQQYRR